MSVFGSNGLLLLETASQAKVTAGDLLRGIIRTVSPIPHSRISAVLNPEANLSMFGVIVAQLALEEKIITLIFALIDFYQKNKYFLLINFQ